MGAPSPNEHEVQSPLARLTTVVQHLRDLVTDVAAGDPVTGTGITLTTPLRRAHVSGTQIGASLPTPGAPNAYERAGRSR